MTPEEKLYRIAKLQRRFINFDTDIKRLWKRIPLFPQAYPGIPAVAGAPAAPTYGGEFCANCDAASSYIRLTFDVEVDGGLTDPNTEFLNWNNGVFNLPLTQNTTFAGGTLCEFKLTFPSEDSAYVDQVRFYYVSSTTAGTEQVTISLGISLHDDTSGFGYSDPPPVPALGTYCEALGGGSLFRPPDVADEGSVHWNDVLIQRFEGTAPPHPS